MNSPSFRLKLTLWSVGTSGTVLVVFGFLFLKLIARVGLERIDRELIAISQLHLREPRPPEHWERLGEALALTAAQSPRPRIILHVQHADGTRLYRSPDWPADLQPQFPAPLERLPPPPREPPRGFGPPRQRLHGPAPITFLLKPSLQTIAHWRVGRLGNDQVTLLVGVDLTNYQAELDRRRGVLLTILPIALAVLAAGGWWLAERALRPIRLITTTAEGITARGLDRRIPAVRADTEFQRLIGVFNAMLDRLEKNFHQAIRFSADASHELKTPLTILQGEIEQSLREATAGSPAQQRYGQWLEEIHRLKTIMRQLLLLAQADAGELPLSREAVDLSALAGELAEDAASLAPHLAVNATVMPGLVVQGDRLLLQQALQNLLSNAIKYNDPNGRIEISGQPRDGTTVLVVGNTGPGIPAVDRAHVFDRFFRGDPSRSRIREGTGLGLSLAREIIRAHGGELTLLAGDDALTRFEVRLPCNP